MIFLQKVLKVLITLSLLSSPASTQRDSWVSPWGKVADFSYECNHWRLKPQVSIPALQQLTVCFNLKLKVQASSPWTAFMYRHPEVQYTELGLGGKWGRLVVWLFGMEWTTDQMNLDVSQWYSLCLTWTHTKDRPVLYINGKPVDIVAAHSSAPSISPSCCKLAPSGTLTLGAAHRLVNGSIQIIPFTGLLGKVSQFRIWGRERSEEEVTSLRCTEGDLVTWGRDDWDTQICGPLPDSSLYCEWSIYEVRLMFAIIRYDGNNTELRTARAIARHWLEQVLPASVYLHRVSVFEVSRSSTEDSLEKTSREDRLVRWTPAYKRFNCLVNIIIIPGLDVAVAQNVIYMDLRIPYHDLSSQLQLLADAESIQTTAVESFAAATTSPPHVVTDHSPVTTTTFKTTTSITTTDTTSSPSASTASTTSTASATTASTATRATTASTASTASSATTASTASRVTTASTASRVTTASTASTATTAITFTTSPANITDLYFEVKVNVSRTGDGDAEQVLSTWLNSSLPDDMMMVLDLQLLSKAQRPNLEANLSTSEPVFVYSVSRERCVFQVQVMSPLSDTQEMEEQIRYLLLVPYTNGSISIATEDVQINRILILKCNAETHQTRKGPFEWPLTSGGRNATRLCPKNPKRYATRHCKLCLRTHWLAPDLEDCSLVVETIPDLEHVNVTAENALDVVEMIEGLLSNHSTLEYRELVTVLDKLEDVVNRSVVTPTLGQALINIISDILESDSHLLPFTNTILNITEAVGDRLVGYNGSSTLVASAIAISVVDVVRGQFGSLSFGVSSDRTGTRPEIFINSYPFNSTVAFISLPSVMQHSFPENDWNQSPPRVTFQFYGIPMLFTSRQKGQTLNTFVVSASVTNASSPIRDLDEHVQVTLHHLIPNALYKDVQCVYWNFNKNNGHGGWDDYGCRKYNSSFDYTTCLCDHLTHFGVLLDVSRTQMDLANEKILTIITYVGCGVSSLFLGITVLTYMAFEKLRRDYPSQILINLSLALLGLNLVFLVDSWLSSWGLYGLCVAVASTLHYFLLASLTWMGLEAVNMYLELVKVFNVYVPSYILKFCALGWGIPLVICTLVLIVNREAYGSHLYTDAQPSLEPLDNSDDFCWLQDNVTFYVSVVAYAMLVFLFNIAVFVVGLIQIRHMRVNSPAGIRSGLMHDLKGVASLTLLLGLTWTVGFFTWGPARIVLLYLFSALNSLQGLFIFLFHCLMKENVRKQWRIHLSFGSSDLKSVLSGATPHQLESWPSQDQILQEHQYPWSTQLSPAPQTALPLPPTPAKETHPAKDQNRAFL